jgi:hypothetical protein
LGDLQGSLRERHTGNAQKTGSQIAHDFSKLEQYIIENTFSIR